MVACRYNHLPSGDSNNEPPKRDSGAQLLLPNGRRLYHKLENWYVNSSYLSKLSKAKFFILCYICYFIFLVRLQGKFEIAHSWERMGWSTPLPNCWPCINVSTLLSRHIYYDIIAQDVLFSVRRTPPWCSAKRVAYSTWFSFSCSWLATTLESSKFSFQAFVIIIIIVVFHPTNPKWEVFRIQSHPQL